MGILSSLSSSSSSCRQTTFNKAVEENGPEHSHGHHFVAMVRHNPHYGEWSDADRIVYDINLIHCQLHWKLLVRKTNSKQLPFITFEVRTNDMTTLVTWQDTFHVNTVSSSYVFVGTYVGSLSSLAQMADATVEEMQCYDLLTSNCQIFCNKMLKRMDIPEFKMTYDSEPDTINRTFDMITEDLIGTSKPTGQIPPASCPIAIPSPSSNNKLTDASKPTGQSAPSAYSMPLPSSSPNSELNTNVSEAKLPCSMPENLSRFKDSSAPMSTTKYEFKKAVPVLSVSDLHWRQCIKY